MLNLKTLANKRWWVTLEESFEQDGSREGRLWNYIIRGKHGHIHVHRLSEPVTLAVSVASRLWINRLAAIPGLTLHQHGDDEATFLFDVKNLNTVASAIKARKRRRVSDAQRQRLAEQLATARKKLGPLPDDPNFNEETLQTFRDMEAGIGVTRYDTPADMYVDLGI